MNVLVTVVWGYTGMEAFVLYCLWQQINIDHVTMKEDAQHALLVGVLGRDVVRVATIGSGASGRGNIFLVSRTPSGE